MELTLFYHVGLVGELNAGLGNRQSCVCNLYKKDLNITKLSVCGEDNDDLCSPHIIDIVQPIMNQQTTDLMYHPLLVVFVDVIKTSITF